MQAVKRDPGFLRRGLFVPLQRRGHASEVGVVFFGHLREAGLGVAVVQVGRLQEKSARPGAILHESVKSFPLAFGEEVDRRRIVTRDGFPEPVRSFGVILVQQEQPAQLELGVSGVELGRFLQLGAG